MSNKDIHFTVEFPDEINGYSGIEDPWENPINADYMRGVDDMHASILYYIKEHPEATLAQLKEYIIYRVRVDACPRCKGR